MTTATKSRPSKGKAKPLAKPRRKPTPKPARDVKFLPVSALHVSKLNMRHGKAAPDIEDIYPSILESGVNQSLLVRKEGNGYGVIAGRRRLFALQRKETETGTPQSAPCLIMESGNIQAAREASLLENVARLPATQLERFAAYKALADSGKDVAAIARTFGIRELDVKRVLALANLKPELLAFYERDEIRGPTLQALTLATQEQQAAWLALFQSDDYAPQGEQLKAWLTGGARIKTDVALFDITDYDGTIITDLFGETGYFQDPDLFWTHQSAAIAKAVADWKAEGWGDVVLLERGAQFCSWEHGKRSKEQGGKVFVSIGHDGTVKAHQGYLTLADIRKIDAILKSGGADDTPAKTDKPEMSGPLCDYVSLHRHAAIRACLLEHSGIALRLTVAHMLVGSPLWSVAPHKANSRKDSTLESVAASKGAKAFEAAQEALLAKPGLTLSDNPYSPAKTIADGDITAVFAALLDWDDAEVLHALTVTMGASLASGSVLIEALGQTLEVDMAALWQPDDAFFDILRDKRVINAMVEEIAGKACADGALTDTAKTQKEIIRNRMKGIGVEANKARPDWRPRWMQVPARHYLDAKTCPPSANAATAKGILSKSAKA